MKVEYINPFINSLLKTFDTLIHIDLERGNPELLRSSDLLTDNYDISGIMALSGKATGVVILSFSRLLALKVVSAFVGQEYLSIDDDVTDAIGELTNIIAGNAKNELPEFEMAITIPTVVQGPNHKIRLPQNLPFVNLPFKSKYGEMHLKLCLKIK